MIAVVLAICTVLGGLAAIWYFVGLARRRKLTHESQVSVVDRYEDKKSRVFFNNGWNGFSTDSDEDVLFYLSLSTSRDFVRYIEFTRPFKKAVYQTSEKGLYVNPRAVPDPYEDSATLSVCFSSTKSGRQSSNKYHEFFTRYNPDVPDTVVVHKADGNEEAMWVWAMEVPFSWLQKGPPFVTAKGKENMRDTVDSWIAAHNIEMRRLKSS